MMLPMMGFGPPNPISTAAKDPDTGRNGRWAVWIELMAKGDLHALSSLYDESSSAIFGLVLAIVNDREAAESLLVEIYERAFKEARTFESEEQTALTWLIARARNLAADHRRRSSAAVHSPADLFKHKGQSPNLALTRLSEEERNILEMTYFGGFTVPEVARALDVTPENVKQQIVVAMRKLSNGGQSAGGVTFSCFSSVLV
jgi:RNA polymerase sigma-70 factor, ECF subfamily